MPDIHAPSKREIEKMMDEKIQAKIAYLETYINKMHERLLDLERIVGSVVKIAEWKNKT